MKIATNVQRNAFGGITISNLALFDWLQGKDDTIVGVEYVTSRHFLGAVIFRHYLPSFFSHHIINGIDIIPHFSWEKAINIHKKWQVLIETTKDILRQEAPDVVLINGTYSMPWILSQAAHELGIPIVLRYAGVMQKEISHKNYFIRKRLLAHERNIVSMAHVVIFPSKLCQHVVEKEIMQSSIKHSVIIPNPVQRTKNLRRRKSLNNRYLIAAIGRWTYIKNFQAFIALHERLIEEQWPHRAVMITSYHDKHFYIPETIERKQPMSQEDLQKFYQSIDLLIVSSYFETFCNVAAEAVMHGCSVLVSTNVGFAEVLQQAGLGRMVIKSFEDPIHVAKVVKKLSKTKLSKQEREAVAKIIDPQKIHENIIHALNGVLENKLLKS